MSGVIMEPSEMNAGAWPPGEGRHGLQAREGWMPPSRPWKWGSLTRGVSFSWLLFFYSFLLIVDGTDLSQRAVGGAGAGPAKGELAAACGPWPELARSQHGGAAAARPVGV